MRRSLPVALALLAGCWPSIPEGQYVCERDQDCPPRWFCVDALCYSQPAERDASTDDAHAEDAGSCAPVSLAVNDLEAGATAELWLDFDAIPGEPETASHVCLTFDTDNPASARQLLLGAIQQIGFGPCGAMGTEGPWTICHPYVKPRGSTSVRVQNSPLTAGCQPGAMTDIELRFLCP